MSRRALIGVASLAAALIAGCGSVPKVPPPAAGSPPHGSVVVHAAGLSFGATVYQELSSVIQPDGITLNYQLSGDPQLAAGSSASSVPLVAAAGATNISRTAARRGLAYVPVGFGAVAVVYHLHGVPSLRLSAATLGAIFTGHIDSWNAAAIARQNPGVSLPHTAILLVHMPSGSLMTQLLSRYLASGSAQWKHDLRGRSRIDWPGGTVVKSESDMMSVVTETPGAIGYLSQATALPNHLQTIALRNHAGRYISPTLAATTKVGDQRPPIPKRRAKHRSKRVRFTFTTINAPVRSAYPVAAELYALTYRKVCGDGAEGHAVGRALTYLTGTAGQALLTQMSFAPLPESLRIKAAAAVQRLNCGTQTS